MGANPQRDPDYYEVAIAVFKIAIALFVVVLLIWPHL